MSFFALLSVFQVLAGEPRVVSLAPSISEILSELYAKEACRWVVGAASGSDTLLRECPQVADIGPFHQPNLEAVIKSRPTLVLVTQDGNPKLQVERLVSLGISVKVVSSGSLESISKSYREVSENLGKEGNLKQILGTINSQIEKLSKLSHPNRSKRVVVQLGRNPLVVLGAGGYLNDLLTLVGVKNIFSHLNAKYPRVSYEEVLKRKPDSVWIVTMSPQDRGDDFWKIKTKIPTVAIAGNDIAQPTLRLLLEAEKWLGIHL